MNIEHWFSAKMSNPNTGEITSFAYPVSKVVCVGRNFSGHAKELNNSVPSTPLLFIKPNTSLVELQQGFKIPNSDSSCHHELEIAILIGCKTQRISADSSLESIAGIGLGLDLTLREAQQSLKSNGHPWEKAKAFDGACPISSFIPFDKSFSLNDMDFKLIKNGETAQQGNSVDMIFNIEELIADISQHFTLLPGDIVLTGTPAGVAALHSGDQLELSLNQFQWTSFVR